MRMECKITAINLQSFFSANKKFCCLLQQVVEVAIFGDLKTCNVNHPFASLNDYL